jgi:hypothetical protein
MKPTHPGAGFANSANQIERCRPSVSRIYRRFVLLADVRTRRMFRLNHYLIIAIAVAPLFAAENCAFARAGPEIAQSASTDATDITSLISLVVARGLLAGAMPDPNALVRLPTPLPGTSVSESHLSCRRQVATRFSFVIRFSFQIPNYPPISDWTPVEF